MKSYFWLFSGISAFAICLGTMIGLSSAPVVGVFLTSILGLTGTILTFWNSKKSTTDSTIDTKKETIDIPKKRNIIFIGISLFLFSVFLLSSTLLGIYFKVRPAVHEPKLFVWTDSTKPKSIEEAIDWILTKERLNAMGFSDASIKKLYEMKDMHDSSLFEFPIRSSFTQKESGVNQNYPSEKPSIPLIDQEYSVGPKDEDAAYAFTSRNKKIHVLIPAYYERDNSSNKIDYLSETFPWGNKYLDNKSKEKIDSLKRIIDSLQNKLNRLTKE